MINSGINDAAWYQFREWLEYFGEKFGKITIAVPPQYTSADCSNCGQTVKKSLSTRTHKCLCSCELDRDENAAINILRIGLSTVGHTGSGGLGRRYLYVDRSNFINVEVSSMLPKAREAHQESAHF